MCIFAMHSPAIVIFLSMLPIRRHFIDEYKSVSKYSFQGHIVLNK